MKPEEIEKIVHSYGKIVKEIFKLPFSLYHYPTLYFPKSLLPYPKLKIKKALEEAIKYSEGRGDMEMLENLKGTLSLLDNFIDDYEAYKRNNKVLSKKQYWESLVKKTSKK